MELRHTGPEEYRLLGRLTDTSGHGNYGSEYGDGPPNMVIHDFLVEGALRGSQLVITELDVRAQAHPYRQCPAIVPSCQALVGKSLASGWRRTVLDTLADGRWTATGLELAPSIVDACHVLTSAGPVIQRARATRSVRSPRPEGS